MFFSAELLKIACAGFSLLTYIILGRYFNSDILVFYVFSQSLIIILSSIFDCGLNIVNLSKDINGFVFKNNKSPNLKYYSLLFFVLVISYVFYTNSFSEYEVSLLLFISIITAPFNIYIMRWNTVYKREGLLNIQILNGELFYILCRSLLVIVLTLFFNFSGFVLALFISASILSLYLNFKYPVDGINPLAFNRTIKDEFVSNKATHAFLLSVLISIKNQILGVVIPLVGSNYQSIFIVISRVYGILVILLSGLHGRIPSVIKNNNTRVCKLLILVALFVPLGFLITSHLWLPIASSVFNIKFSFDTYIYFLIFVIGSGITISFLSMTLQVINRNISALTFELLYLLILIIIILVGS